MEQPVLLRDGWTAYRIKKWHYCCCLWEEQLVNLGLGFSGAHHLSHFHTVFSISTLVGLKRESREKLWKNTVIDNMVSPHIGIGQLLQVLSQKWFSILSILPVRLSSSFASLRIWTVVSAFRGVVENLECYHYPWFSPLFCFWKRKITEMWTDFITSDSYNLVMQA